MMKISVFIYIYIYISLFGFYGYIENLDKNIETKMDQKL